MGGKRLRLGTRGSPLALAQADIVGAALAAAEPGIVVERVVIRTTGDRQAEAAGGAPVPAAGKGVFVREIEEALLGGSVDLAVHSLKDLPVETPEGLAIAAVLEREDVRDAFCSRDGRTLSELQAGARVATSSLRRSAQLRRAYPSLEFVPVRGNVGTRLRKMSEGAADGAILAGAGLRRLGLGSAITELIPVEVCLPAPGQGAIACEIRGGDAATAALAARLNHPVTMAAVRAERAFLEGLGGGCGAPIAAYGRPAGGDALVLMGFAGEPAGVRFVASSIEGPLASAAELGTRLAARLLDEGASALLSR